MHPGRGLAVTASDDRTARIWDLATGALRHVLRPLAAGSEVGRLYGAAVHPTQPLVAVAGTSGSAATAHLNIRKLVWSADGTVLLAGYSGDPASTPANSHGVRAFALDGRELLDDRLPGPVFGLAVTVGGQAAAVGLDGTLRSYRAGNGAASVVNTTQISGRRPAGVSFSPGGSRLAVAYATPREGPEIFDSATLGSSGLLPAETLFGGDWRVLTWSADGRSIYVGGTAYTQALRFPVLQFDVASARVMARIDAASDSITDLQALPLGEVAHTSFEGSWGVIENVSAYFSGTGTGSGSGSGNVSGNGNSADRTSPQVLRRVGAPVATVRGNAPLDLALSDDARTLELRRQRLDQSRPADLYRTRRERHRVWQRQRRLPSHRGHGGTNADREHRGGGKLCRAEQPAARPTSPALDCGCNCPRSWAVASPCSSCATARWFRC